MRVGYFGGSFDPPHRGHLAVARAARDRFALSRVLLAPTGRQPLKPEGATASYSDRLRMTALLCKEERGLEPSAIDAPRPDGSANYTAETLYTLRDSLPRNASLFAILGADAFLNIRQWHAIADLFTLAEWIVVSRPGSFLPPLPELGLSPQQQTRVQLLEDVQDPVSATALRARLRAHEPCEDLLPLQVLAYIEQHGLYQSL